MTRAESWRQKAEVFHERADEYDSWFEDSLLFAIETEAVRSLPTPLQHPALEIGVGPGRFARALESGFGIDPAMAPLRIAAQRGITVCQAIGEALPFGAGSFARVSLFFTLCFVENPDAVVAEAHRVLRDKGQLILGFVPISGKWGEALEEKKSSGHPFYQYASFFSVKQVVELLEHKGFHISSSASTLYQEPGHVSLLETSKPTIDEKAGFIVLAAVKMTGYE